MIFEKIREKIEEKAFSVQLKQGIKEPSTFDAMEEKFSVREIKDIINQVEAEYNNGWISCSERLPDVEADVLLSLRSLDIYTGFRANTEGCFYVEGEGYVEYDNVLAWQPLPEPYTPKGE